MSLAIKNGLFKLNITDHHAILGVSLDAEPQKIRTSYLKIAQKLHPDKCRSDLKKMKTAGQILSKLVNPAYEQMSRKSNFAEHQLVLTKIGKRLAENKDKINVTSEAAQELLKAGASSAELVYGKLLKKLTTDQYKSLSEVTQNIGVISELNLVYLMLKGDRLADSRPTHSVNQPPVSKTADQQKTVNKQTISQSKSTMTQANAPEEVEAQEPTIGTRVNAFVGRAQKYISKGEFDLAVTELRDALRIDPNHGVAHAVMGKAYLHKKQLTMAKVHISKACNADPHNPIVIESKKTLDKLSKQAGKPDRKSKPSNSKSNNKPGNSGLFSGFFGAKKK